MKDFATENLTFSFGSDGDVYVRSLHPNTATVEEREIVLGGEVLLGIFERLAAMPDKAGPIPGYFDDFLVGKDAREDAPKVAVMAMSRYGEPWVQINLWGSIQFKRAEVEACLLGLKGGAA